MVLVFLESVTRYKIFSLCVIKKVDYVQIRCSSFLLSLDRSHNIGFQVLMFFICSMSFYFGRVTRRSLCLGSNLEVLNNGSSAQPVQLNSNSIFPYLAQSPSTSAACALRNNNPIQNLTGGGGMSPFKLDVTTHAINSPSSKNPTQNYFASNRSQVIGL